MPKRTRKPTAQDIVPRRTQVPAQSRTQDIIDAYERGLASKQTKAGSDPTTMRHAAIVLSAMGVKLSGNKIIITGSGIENDDQFSVEAYRRFLGALEEVDPRLAQTLRAGGHLGYSFSDDGLELEYDEDGEGRSGVFGGRR